MAAKLQAPIHPGEVLREEFMIPMGLSSHALVRALGVTAACVNDIVNEKRGITADTPPRPGRYFDTMANVWIDLQKVVRAREALILIVIPGSRSHIRTAFAEPVPDLIRELQTRTPKAARRASAMDGASSPVPSQFSALHESHWVQAFLAPQSAAIHGRSPRRRDDERWG